MNMLKKGPELKMPGLKVPDFLLDLYYDLRERHLLPLVAILLVALVALPILLRGSSDSESAESGAAIATPSAAPQSANLVVAKAAPGLRDYRKRLAGTPTDPFIQKYTSSGGGAGVPASGSVTMTQSEPPSEASFSGGSKGISAPAETEASDGEGKNEDGDEKPATGQPRYYSFAIDVRIVETPSGAGKAKPSIRRDLPELTMLPSREEPALTFMDVSKDEKKVLMLVSDKVTSLFGDAVCVVGSERCQLLALERGIPETVVYGPQERTFRIELLKLSLEATEKPNKAPLSEPKDDGKSPEGQAAE